MDILNFSNKKAIIRLYNSSDNLVEITKMIRTSYKVLADKGFRYWGTFQTEDDTKTRFSYGIPFLIEIDNKVVGTITLNKEFKGEENAKWYKEKSVCYFSQFAVSPNFQKSGLGSSIMTYIENYAKLLGFEHIALDTCESAYNLIKYYEKRGYQFKEYVQWDLSIVNYRSVILSKPLRKNNGS